MNARARWFDDFVKWFFNASPMWVDERKILRATPQSGEPLNRRGPARDRRRGPDPRGARQRPEWSMR